MAQSNNTNAQTYAERLPARFRVQRLALINSLLPSLLRKPKQKAWLQVLLSPLSSLYEQFARHVATSARELSYNGQTMLPERALNDRFDSTFRRIKIINSDTELEPVYLNFVSEQQQLPATYFITEQQPLLRFNSWVEYISQIGFTVRVPRSISPQEAAMQARIKQLKLSLIRHKLAYF